MKYSLLEIVDHQIDWFDVKKKMDKRAVMLIKLEPDGSIDQRHLYEGLSASAGKQGPSLSYVISMETLEAELDKGYSGNPMRRYFIENADKKIFEARLFPRNDCLVILAEHVDPEEDAGGLACS